jgi:hypothetical protein
MDKSRRGYSDLFVVVTGFVVWSQLVVLT